IMCRAMNRHLGDILLGKTSAPTKREKAEPAAVVKEAQAAPSGQAACEKESPAEILRQAKNVIIVPGYGMALAQAQQTVKQLADRLEARGAQVRFAIHPVAGRMPGHMNVLLCEADVPYEQLYEMDAINDGFKACDAVLVIGANDVVNPAANTAEGTPIYGMPVLNVADAKHVIICNYDLKPGYAGVENPLYHKKEGVSLLLGDAKDTLQALCNELNANEAQTAPTGAEKIAETPVEEAGEWLHDAKEVIIVPGYGMALAQAQKLVKQLADQLEQQGKEVKFAIHPVAGRMPGHMNVLLCEADVPYEQLYEMDAIDDEFKECDVAVVVGANDVVNPAANTAEGTPIYGMPVLSVDQAKHVIICNYDLKPGYAGVENPLYHKPGVSLLLGDAQVTLQSLLTRV
ncbi:MAG: NAD(P)(+) transhydrogenase (Re/Si-specific) subunit beta, partial [Acutalibacteraceae bacterium]